MGNLVIQAGKKTIVIEQSHYLGLRNQINHWQFCRASRMYTIQITNRTGVPNRTLLRNEVPKIYHSYLLLAGCVPHANIVNTSTSKDMKVSPKHSWNLVGGPMVTEVCHSLSELPYCHP